MEYINKTLLKSSDLSALFNLTLPVEKEIEKLTKKYCSDKWTRFIFTKNLFRVFILLIFLLDRKVGSLRGITEFSSNLLFQTFTHLRPCSKTRKYPYYKMTILKERIIPKKKKKKGLIILKDHSQNWQQRQEDYFQK